jgi:hypothetical protein
MRDSVREEYSRPVIVEWNKSQSGYEPASAGETDRRDFAVWISRSYCVGGGAS